MKQQSIAQIGLTFEDVYVSDMGVLKHIYEQHNMAKNITGKNFGVPFLLMKYDGLVIGFATILSGENGSAEYVVYSLPEYDILQGEEVFLAIGQRFEAEQMVQSQDQQQLQESIECMVNWLNLGVSNPTYTSSNRSSGNSFHHFREIVKRIWQEKFYTLR